MSTQIHTTSFLQAAPGSGANSALSVTLPSVTEGVYNRSLLKRAYPYLMHQMFGEQYPLGLRQGQTMVFRRYEKLAQNTIPLTEGVTPTGTSLVKRDYKATVKQYGDYVIISDFVDMTHVDPIIQQSVELLGEAMGESMDSVYREYLVIGSAAYFVKADGTDTTARSTVAGSLCPAAMDEAIQTLKREEAKPFKPMIPGSTGNNTWPVAPCYWALIHTDIELDLYNNFDIAGASTIRNPSTSYMTGLFVPVEQYSQTGSVMENEVGKYRNVRFVTSTNTKIHESAGAGSIDVYVTLVFGRNAYGVVPLQRGSGRVILQQAGGNTDPLEQRNTVGWKAAGTALILNDAWMFRIEHAKGVLTPA